MITESNVHAAFHPQQATEEQVRAMNVINDAAESFARVILRFVHQGSDQQAAIRKVREAAMTANKGVVTSGSL